MSHWVHGWISKGRLDNPDALTNQDLWKQLVSLARKHKVTWEWLRGHAGHPFNERCDKLAKRAAENGIRAAAAANQPEETEQKKKLIPLPVAPVNREPVPFREKVAFDIEEDGQLRLC
jgi:ribonuclease HI